MKDGNVFDILELIKNTRGIITYTLRHVDDRISEDFLNFIYTELKNEFNIITLDKYYMEDIDEIANKITKKTILIIDISFVIININHFIDKIPFKNNIIFFLKKYTYSTYMGNGIRAVSAFPSKLLYKSTLILSLDSNMLKIEKCRSLNNFDYIDLNKIKMMIRKRKLEKLSNLTQL